MPQTSGLGVGGAAERGGEVEGVEEVMEGEGEGEGEGVEGEGVEGEVARGRGEVG